MDELNVFRADALEVRVYDNSQTLAVAAARMAQIELQARIAQQGLARVVFATGNSQKEFLEFLTTADGIDWSRVTCFHLDEYLGIDPEHPASFRKELRDRVENRIHPQKFHYLRSDTPDPVAECQRYARLLQESPLDLCILGVGDNGHLAFNEPEVADFHDPQVVKVVPLNAITQQQQVNSGNFPHLDAVPKFAMTLTLPLICASKTVLCLAPGAKKAKIVQTLLQGEIQPACPASVLRTQPQAILMLDVESAAKL